MEKLIVRNFGPIKYVELDIKKVNIFIGSQGTGKSTLVKLLAILNDSRFIKQQNISFFIKCLKDFNINGFYSKTSYIKYTSIYTIEVSKGKFAISDIPQKLIDTYDNLLQTENRLRETAAIDNSEDSDIYLKSLKNLTNYLLSTSGKIVRYIPAERMLISSISNSLFSFINNHISLADYIIEFGQHYEIIKKRYDNYYIDFLKLSFSTNENEGDYILVGRKKIKLSEAASGLQSIIPLVLSVINIKSTNMPQDIIIEEPELNLFPSTQYDLIKYIISNINGTPRQIFLTTHSPYILSALNNLMFAFQTGQVRPKLTGKIVDKSQWLNPNLVSAYMLSNGNSENILDEEVMQIKAEKIDVVSRVINEEYDSLLNIKYSKK